MSEQSKKTRDPRTLVIMAMYMAGRLNDETLPPERFTIFKEQPFSQWPTGMQTELAEFGATMIV
jgi:hypothetical protein